MITFVLLIGSCVLFPFLRASELDGKWQQVVFIAIQTSRPSLCAFASAFHQLYNHAFNSNA